MKNETASITVTPSMAGTVNHAVNNEMVKITNSVYLAHGTVMEREERLRRREQYCARETAGEKIKVGSQKSTQEKSACHDVDREVTSAAETCS